MQTPFKSDQNGTKEAEDGKSVIIAGFEKGFMALNGGHE